MPIKFPCGICHKSVARNHRALQCDTCEAWIHIKCNYVSANVYERLKESTEAWFCINCIKDNLPLFSVSGEQLILLNQGKNLELDDIPENIDLENSKNVAFFKEINGIKIKRGDGSTQNSDYYTPSEFNKIETGNVSLSLLHLNISSLGYHFDALNCLLDIINRDINLIGITETRNKKGKGPNTNINLANYQIVECQTESNKGGALLYISNKHDFVERADLQMYKTKELESVFVEIPNPTGKNYIVGCIYRHPNMDITEFIDIYLNRLFEKIKKEKKEIILLGDFNINLMNFENNKETNDYLELITTNSLIPLILKPTRITSHSQTLIDNILTNITEKKVVAGNITTSISDHLMQFAIFQTDTAKRREETTPKHDFRKFNRNDFILDILQVDWNKHLKICEDNANKSMNTFLTLFESITQKHAPLTKPAKRKAKINNKPWITAGLLNSINKKNSLYKRYIKEKNSENKENLHNQYKCYRNLVSTLSRNSKTAYFEEFFLENKNNIKNAWKGIKSIINSKNKNSSVPLNIIVNGSTEKDPEVISNAFNTYFGTIAAKTKAKIPKTNKDFNDYLTNPNDKSIFLSPTNAKEIHDLILALNDTKAVGPGSIPTRLLKIVAPTISDLLCQIINLSFKNGIFPNCIKEANIIPVHKKEAHNIIGNYRPISLLSNVGKIIEKLIHIRVYSFLTKNDLFFTNQFGFRNHHNTNHALIQITEKLRHAIDNGQFACGVFVDLQKAFDTVEHSILLHKLNYYGIRGVANDWFKSYLTNRQQHVTVYGKKSRKLDIKHGVPQGSVLGPLLFLIYINDLHKAIKNSDVYHFADDTSLIHSSTSLKKLNKNINHDLKLLCEWLRANKISLNASKTELIIFRTKQKTISKNLNFRISGQKLVPQSLVKYLGIQIDEHLTFQHHLKVSK